MCAVHTSSLQMRENGGERDHVLGTYSREAPPTILNKAKKAKQFWVGWSLEEKKMKKRPGESATPCRSFLLSVFGLVRVLAAGGGVCGLLWLSCQR